MRSSDRSEVIHGRTSRAHVLEVDWGTLVGQEQGPRLQGPLERQGYARSMCESFRKYTADSSVTLCGLDDELEIRTCIPAVPLSRPSCSPIAFLLTALAQFIVHT